MAWFLPGVASSLIVGVIVSSSMARALGTRRLVAWLLAVSVGVILSATVTPIGSLLAGGDPGARSCDFSRIGLLGLDELISLRDASLNIALFAPLGWAIAFLPNSSKRLLLMLAAVTLPFAIEGVQLWASALGRGCESADVIDNLTGLAVGFAGGTTVLAVQATRAACRASGDGGD